MLQGKFKQDGRGKKCYSGRISPRKGILVQEKEAGLDCLLHTYGINGCSHLHNFCRFTRPLALATTSTPVGLISWVLPNILKRKKKKSIQDQDSRPDSHQKFTPATYHLLQALLLIMISKIAHYWSEVNDTNVEMYLVIAFE